MPVFRAKLRRLYLHYLKWFRCLKRDPVHEEVMKTLRRFMDEEEEAADAAVDRQTFLLNRIFQPRPVPKNEEEEEEEEKEEEEEDEEDKESWPWDCAVNRVGQMKLYCNEPE